jgi:tRNA modification GTPase
MTFQAALLTEQKTGAISAIKLYGENIGEEFNRIFRKGGKVSFTENSLHSMNISYDGQQIDQVTVAFENAENIIICCHGNFLIVSRIFSILEKEHFKITTPEQLLTAPNDNMLIKEAVKLLPHMKTIEAVKLLNFQINEGLVEQAKKWKDSDNVEAYREEIRKIIEQSRKYEPVIQGCKVVLAGAANSGKSTIFNIISGKDKAIVTDIEGTTRDYLHSQVSAGAVMCSFYDTAGLSEMLTDTIDVRSQVISLELVKSADIILWFVDASNPKTPDIKIRNTVSEHKIIYCVNKTDRQEPEFDKFPSESVFINKDMPNLTKVIFDKILNHLELNNNFDYKTVICYTDRQIGLLEELLTAKDDSEWNKIITRLFQG